MATIKIFINGIILLLTSIIGYAYGNIYTRRARNLLDLQYCIRVLESEIINGNVPLPQALENTSVKGRGSISILFKEIKDDLTINKREDIFHSFLRQKYNLKDRYALKTEDIEVFLYLGKILGKSSRGDQEKNMRFIISQLDNLYIEAQNEEAKNAKLYRTLGFLAGLVIVIILI